MLDWSQLEPGPFTDQEPVIPPAPFARPQEFVKLLLPYAGILDGASAAIDRLHADMVGVPGVEDDGGGEQAVASALIGVQDLAAVNDGAALAPVLDTLAAVRGDVRDQVADLPGPEDETLEIPDRPPEPPEWSKQGADLAGPAPPTPTSPTPTTPAPGEAPIELPAPGSEPGRIHPDQPPGEPPVPQPSPEPIPEPTPGPEPSGSPEGHEPGERRI